MLNAALDNVKVVRQAYHGIAMVGNHCHVVLKHFTKLTRVLGDRDDELLFNEIFGLFKDITMLMSAPRFLNDQEIDRLEELCFDFGAKFSVDFPERNITRKIHELVFRVPEFVRQFRTLGLLSEQEGESKHAAINAELRSLASVRSRSKKLELVLEKEELRSFTDKSLVQAKSRLCKMCNEKGTKTFLRCSKDGIRCCPTCQKDRF